MIAGNGYYQAPASGSNVLVTVCAFTPIIAASTNATIASVLEGYATKVGKEVTFSGSMRMSVPAAGLCSVTFDLPYPPDNNEVVSGCGTFAGVSGGPYILTVMPDGTGNVTISFTATILEAAAQTPFTITYKAAT
jgi:hypothetical protein